MRTTSSPVLQAATFGCLLALPTVLTRGADYEWIGADNAEWGVPANWRPAGVPGDGDTALVSGRVNAPDRVVLRALTLIAGDFSGNVTVTDTMRWTAGTVGGVGRGSLTVAPGAFLRLEGTASKQVYGAITNAGTVVWSGSGYLGVFNTGETPDARGAIHNLPGGVFDVQTDSELNASHLGATFYNEGLLEKSAGVGIATINIILAHTGSLDVRSGTLELANDGQLQGSVSIQSGARLNLAAGNITSDALTLHGSGSLACLGALADLRVSGDVASVAVTAGRLAVSGAWDVGQINLTGGEFTTEAALHRVNLSGGSLVGTNLITDTCAWTGGTLSGAWTVAVGAAMVLAGDDPKTLDGWLTNAGNITLTNNGGLVFSRPHGALVNLAGGVFDFAGDQSLGPGGLSPVFHNAGLVRKSAGAGTNLLDSAFDSTGGLVVRTGTMRFLSGGNWAGRVEVQPGARITLAGGRFTGGDLSATIGGELRCEGADAAFAGQLNLLELGVDGGSLALDGEVVVGGAQVTAGTLAANGIVTNLDLQADGVLAGTNTFIAGLFNWTAKDLRGPVTIAPGARLSIAGDAQKGLYGALTNAGTVDWAGAGSLVLYDNGNGLSDQSGSIHNLAGGVFTLRNDLFIGDAWGHGTFHNQGRVLKSEGQGTNHLYCAFVQSGTLEVWTGVVSLVGPTEPGGTFAVGLSSSTAPGRITFGTPVALSPANFRADLLDGFLPGVGDSFEVIGYGLCEDEFGQTTLPGLYTWTTNYADHAFTLQVAGIVPIQIRRAPAPQLVAAGQSLTLDADFEGPGPLRFQWLFNQHELPGATNATLVFTNPPANLAGSYALRVSNPLTNVVTDEALVTFSLSPTLAIGSDLGLTLSGAPGSTCRVEVAAAVVPNTVWVVLTNLALPTTPIRFTDPTAGTSTQRFYRARQLP